MSSSVIFRPATALMGKLPYSSKFLVVFLIFIIPLGLLTTLLLSSLNQEISITQQQRQGVVYMQAVRPLLEHVPQHRGMTNAFLNGKPEFKDKILDKRKTIELAVETVDEAAQAGAELELGPDEAHHVGRVLRLEPGERIRLFDGAGREWEALILDATRPRIVVRLERECVEPVEAPLELRLFQGLKSGQPVTAGVVELPQQMVPVAAIKRVAQHPALVLDVDEEVPEGLAETGRPDAQDEDIVVSNERHVGQPFAY